MSGPIPYDDLFDPDFLGQLSHLSITARRIAGGGRYGEKLSKDMGTGVEFKDFRPYARGDDLRSIDWNIYRRLGRVFIRLFEEQQDMPLYLMPDLSESMFLEENLRAKAAFKASLALASISMNHHDSAGLFPFGDELQVVLKNKSGKANVMTFARHMSMLKPEKNTNLAQSIEKLSSMNLRPGLLVIVSDFFTPDGLKAIRKSLRSVRHKLLFIQITRTTDAEPDLTGELQLQDCESGEVADIAITPHVLKKYKAAYLHFNEELATMAKKNRAGLLQLDADEDVVAQLSVLFQSGNLQV